MSATSGNVDLLLDVAQRPCRFLVGHGDANDFATCFFKAVNLCDGGVNVPLFSLSSLTEWKQVLPRLFELARLSQGEFALWCKTSHRCKTEASISP
jgi:hypothetical protein